MAFSATSFFAAPAVEENSFDYLPLLPGDAAY